MTEEVSAFGNMKLWNLGDELWKLALVILGILNLEQHKLKDNIEPQNDATWCLRFDWNEVRWYVRKANTLKKHGPNFDAKVVVRQGLSYKPRLASVNDLCQSFEKAFHLKDMAGIERSVHKRTHICIALKSQNDT